MSQDGAPIEQSAAEILGGLDMPAVTAADTKPKSGTESGGKGVNSPARSLTDDQGNVFDPDVHEADRDGNPKYRKAKKLGGKKVFAKRRGAKPKGETQTAQSVLPEDEGEAQGEDAAEATGEPGPALEEVSAGQVVALEEVFAMAAFGESSRMSDDERAALMEGWKEAFRHIGPVSTHWGVQLAIAHLPWFSKIGRQPKTQKRLSGFKGWLGAKIGAMRGRRAATRKREPEKAEDSE